MSADWFIHIIGNEMSRSFAALRMTTKQSRVILSAAKDLYDSNS